MKWQPIETAPKEVDVLVSNAKIHEAYAVASWDTNEFGKKFWFTADGAGYEFDFFTHWMFPPPPPQAQSSDEEPQSGDEVSAADRTASLTQKIASLEASLALCERRAEDAEARNVFLETEIVALAEKAKR